MPRVSRPATERLRFCAGARSIRVSPSWMPCWRAFASWVTRSALESSALVGMHPTFRQTPPSSSYSTQAALSPSWAARMAAT